VFEVLLHLGANIHLPLPDTWDNGTYLHICAVTGQWDLFFPEQISKPGVEIDRVDKKGLTPFGLAVAQRSYPVADPLH